MNVIILSHFKKFDSIINAPILLTSKTNCNQEEIYENMWAISFNEKLVPPLNNQTLKIFIDTLIQQRQKQVDLLNCPATLYFWHDAQAAQLRFNLLSGRRSKLPFGCTVELENSIDTILDAFLVRGSGYIPLDEIEFLDPDDECDENEIPCILKVFCLFLTPHNEKSCEKL
ncbi:MAG: hypothetical protein WA432_03730 [Candidatus Babeliaceae bacterium]